METAERGVGFELDGVFHIVCNVGLRPGERNPAGDGLTVRGPCRELGSGEQVYRNGENSVFQKCRNILDHFNFEFDAPGVSVHVH
ncbi:hypothetical protein SDC9_196626 [bioreactor metagenome]|uniref:Uncharacterized protein n=1 Tax=bioreactor metagenome TaxID=1076179 RepID=A0A645IP41_9ZZZZ